MGVEHRHRVRRMRAAPPCSPSQPARSPCRTSSPCAKRRIRPQPARSRVGGGACRQARGTAKASSVPSPEDAGRSAGAARDRRAFEATCAWRGRRGGKGDERQRCEAPGEKAGVGDPGRDPYREIPTAAAEVSKVVVEGKLHAQRRMTLQKRCQGVQQRRGERGGGGDAHRALDPTGAPRRLAAAVSARAGPRTSARKRSPSGVRESARVERRNSRAPCAASKRPTRRATAAGVTPSRRAAPAKEPASATRRTTTAARRESIAIQYIMVVSAATPFVLPWHAPAPLPCRHQKRRALMRIGIVGIGASGADPGYHLGARGSRSGLRLARPSSSD